MTQIGIKAELPWIAFESEDGEWLALCPPLGLTAEGGNREELDGMIAEILDDWFRARLADGSLDRVLLQHGWTRSGTVPQDPGEARFHVPHDLQKVTREDFQRSLHS